MNYRKTTWETAKGQDVWIKRQDTGEMEKWVWKDDGWLDPRGTWHRHWVANIGLVPYLETDEAVEITLGEAMERRKAGLLVEDEDGTPYYYDFSVNFYFRANRRFFIPACKPEPPKTVTLTVEVEEGRKEAFLERLGAFDGAEVKE